MLTKRNLRPTPPKLLEIRPLTPNDLRVLAEGRGQKQTVAKLRDSHHLVAKLVAAGLRFAEVAERSGFSMSAIYRFNGDPAFQELVAVYRREENARYILERDNFNAIMHANAMKAQRRIADRLDDDEEAISTRDLISIAGDNADRIGYGKRSTQVNVNIGLGEAIDQARARLSARTVEGTAVLPSSPSVVPSAQPSPPRDSLDRRGM